MRYELSTNYVPLSSLLLKVGGHVPQLLWERRPWFQSEHAAAEKTLNFSDVQKNQSSASELTTAVYAESGRNPLFKCMSQWQN